MMQLMPYFFGRIELGKPGCEQKMEEPVHKIGGEPALVKHGVLVIPPEQRVDKFLLRHKQTAMQQYRARGEVQEDEMHSS